MVGHRILQIVCVFSLLFTASLSALDPEKEISQYVLAHWTTEDGLPQNSVNTLLQTRDGYLWIATFGGLARFDGVHFTVYDAVRSPGLGSNRLTALLEDRRGRLWIGSEDGKLIRKRRLDEGGGFETLDLPADPEIGGVWDLYEDQDGRIWIAALRRLLVVEAQDAASDHPTPRLLDSALFPFGALSLTEDKNGRLLVGGRDGYVRYDGTNAQSFDFSGHDPPLRGLYGFLSADDSPADDSSQGESLWLGTISGLARHDADGLEAVALARHDSMQIAGEMVRDRDGTIWFTRAGYVLRLRLDPEPRIDRFASEGWLRALYEDREGNLWIGSDGNGLYRLHDGPFTTWKTQQGFTDAGVLPILETRDGEIWIGTFCDGVFRSRGGKFQPFDDLPWLRCARSLMEDRRGRLWLGGAGLGVRDGESMQTLFVTGDLQSPENVGTIYQERSGTIWVGSAGRGLRSYSEDLVEGERFGVEDGLVHGDVRFLTEDRGGRLWIGTHQGMGRLETDRRTFASFTVEDGLPHGFVRAIHEDETEDALWLGTYGGGLVYFEDDRVRQVFSTANGLAENVVSRILVDGDDFWTTGNRGVSRIPRADLRSFLAGDSKGVASTLYGRADGMLVSETNGGGQPAGIRASDGRLWFPTVQGAAAVDPRRLRSPAPPALHLEHVFVDQEEVELPWGENARLALPPSDEGRHLEVRYAGIRLALPREVRFRHRLKGFVDEWIPVGGRREVYHSLVPPGNYRFEVQAASYRGGEWSEAVGFDLEIRPHWHQILWLRILIAAALLGGASLLAYRVQARRLRRAREHAQELSEANLRMEDEIHRRREVERERELVIQELESRTEELESITYTVSHDLKSPLVTIRGFLGMVRKDLESNRPERAQRDLGRIEGAADRMALLLDEILEISRIGRRVNPPENVDLGELAREAAELVGGNIRASGAVVEIDELLPRRPVDRPRMLEVYQNLIDNAVRFLGDQPQPRVEVGFREEQGREEQGRESGVRTVFFVRDNGIGIDPAYHSKIFGLFERLETGVEGTGVGLALVRRIIEVHGGSIWVESEGIGRGACFCFTLGEQDG